MTGRPAVALLVVAIVLAGCGAASTPYFQESLETEKGSPAAVGESLYAGSTWLVANPGDDVRLLSAEALEPSLNGAVLTWHVLQLGALDDTAIGFASPGSELADRLVDLAGATVPAGSSQGRTGTQVVVGVHTRRPGTIMFRAVRLRFTVNGNGRTQDFPVAVVVCVDDPAPTSCARPSG